MGTPYFALPNTTASKTMPLGGSGQNQFGSYPSMGSPPASSQAIFSSGNQGGPWGGFPPSYNPTTSSGTPPGMVPQQPGMPFGSNAYPTTASKEGGFGLQGGAATIPQQDPQFSQEYGSMLGGQLGKGLNPFNLSTPLPTGGQTGAGQLSAPMLQQLQQLLQSGGLPTEAMQGLAKTGDPISQLPAWQAMVAAENQNTQLGATNLKEQMGSMGALSSSNAADAMSQFMQQTTLGQNAQLTQAETQAQQQAVQNMMSEGQFGASLTQSVGEFGQGLDTTAIQNLLQQYTMDLPQFNPMLSQEQQLATTYPGVYTKQGGIGSALLGSAGGIASGLSELIPALAGI